VPRALVVGAGIGGLAAAIALDRAGVEPLVLERAGELREAGFGLVLQPNAVAALDRLGLREQIAVRGRRVEAAEIRDPRGEPISTLPFGALGVETYGILRGELQQALLDAVPAERLRLGSVCEEVEVEGRVLLAGGDELHAEAVVGADGIHSAVRTSLHGLEPLRYGGYRAWRAGTRFHLPPRFVEVWGIGGGFGFGPVGERDAYWYCFETVAEDAPPLDRTREGLLRRYGDWFDPIPALIESTAPESIHAARVYDRRPLRQWGRGRVTLLGDAAHPMKPNLGQGAAQALEDAVVLGESLAGADDLEAGLRAYERRRTRRANAVVRASRQAGRAAEAHTAAGARVRDTLARALPDRVVVARLRRLVQGFR
jgi:2-polyprenyl-6-methoxyphenol hydroxylase-like FAD-dependent oxidoreductase